LPVSPDCDDGATQGRWYQDWSVDRSHDHRQEAARLPRDGRGAQQRRGGYRILELAPRWDISAHLFLSADAQEASLAVHRSFVGNLSSFEVDYFAREIKFLRDKIDAKRQAIDSLIKQERKARKGGQRNSRIEGENYGMALSFPNAKS
jgi:hypothetical protein